jgi:hypothetical protein
MTAPIPVNPVRLRVSEDGVQRVKSLHPVFPLTIPSGKPNSRLIVPVAPPSPL